MGDRCCVKSCREKRTPEGPSFHSFPKEPTIRHCWCQALGIDNIILVKRTLICSKHFEKDCLQKRFGRIVIKSGSIPSVLVSSENKGLENESVGESSTQKMTVEQSQGNDASRNSLSVIKNSISLISSRESSAQEMTVSQSQGNDSSRNTLPLIKNCVSLVSGKESSAQKMTVEQSQNSDASGNTHPVTKDFICPISSREYCAQEMTVGQSQGNDASRNTLPLIKNRIFLISSRESSSQKMTVSQSQSNDASRSTLPLIKNCVSLISGKESSAQQMTVEQSQDSDSSGNTPPGKRKFYFKDFTKDDMENPTYAKMFFERAKKEKANSDRKINALRNRYHRLTKKVSKLNSLLELRKNRQIISGEGMTMCDRTMCDDCEMISISESAASTLENTVPQNAEALI